MIFAKLIVDNDLGKIICGSFVVNVMYSHLAYLERSSKKAFTSIRE